MINKLFGVFWGYLALLALLFLLYMGAITYACGFNHLVDRLTGNHVTSYYMCPALEEAGRPEREAQLARVAEYEAASRRQMQDNQRP